ncbi:hypothetical protein HA402_014991 [Bradysia odoriphaga]|nr:hypothetical protein HA402_014991 [Bradysia odoriphaga]
MLHYVFILPTQLLVFASIITINNAQFQIQPTQQSSGFISPQLHQVQPESDSDAAGAVNYRTQVQTYEYDEEEEAPQATPQQPIRRQQQPYVRSQNQKAPNQKQILEELEEEEPDRLAMLLEKSSFNCDGRTGYYADEGLGCEVFHYCQENQKHSWICPEGFSFHQVHLICMPPSGENICQQSSKYHVVNDYLYKPVNLAEHESKPNITLRYSERYYPENFYQDDRQDDYPQDRQRQAAPLRKPQPTPNPSYRPPYQQAQSNVYRSPDDINIPLQQRRPQIIFSPTTARYEEEEYNYEK